MVNKHMLMPNTVIVHYRLSINVDPYVSCNTLGKGCSAFLYYCSLYILSYSLKDIYCRCDIVLRCSHLHRDNKRDYIPTLCPSGCLCQAEKHV